MDVGSHFLLAQCLIADRRACAMGNCWTQCCRLFRKEANRIQRSGGSKYFRTSSIGEHFTIEFENLVESDEAESPGFNQRPINEDEVQILQNRQYDAISQKQVVVDKQLQTELAAQEEQLRIEEEAFYAAQREAARAAKQKKLLEQQRLQKVKQRTKSASSSDQQKSETVEEDFESYLQHAKSQSEAFRNQHRISSEATILTPNTESSCDLTTKTKSTNDDSTSLDLEWEDEEGINRMIPMRERSRTEEDILQAALRHSSHRPGSNPLSASDESTGLEWENDFVSAELDDNGNSEYAGFVNPVLEHSPNDMKNTGGDKQSR
ncbi:AP-1 complex-associated regulatory protein isoform X1 [Chiloscyllium plagiosum]|uniref:AP-1 complex-associated regulatory protein isoform X1 n=1 Tax=Chiloscyllium plagiosum TaxID=36176 RepID=UPI001CB8078C|nr:AP-1 complex-associated regulatory protein isoform X1 [Chiloscyllium plagiosum]